MEIHEVRRIADALGVRYGLQASKIHLIDNIQLRTGKPACFASNDRDGCLDESCRWRQDCLKPIAVWRH